LAPNPSHLETVGAVIEGITELNKTSISNDFSKVLPIAVHGDAALQDKEYCMKLFKWHN
jgi:2-oxoglutarate dehydrogenase E1 component